MKTVIFDMDGTLANIGVRRKYLEGETKDWKSFNSKLKTDIPNKDICELARMYAVNHIIIICTGRFRSVGSQTIEQLRIWNVPYQWLLMRDNEDYRSDEVVKKEMLEFIIDGGFDPIIAVDDRDRVVKMWRDNGLRCLQVAKGDF